jgi:hypothetical protein
MSAIFQVKSVFHPNIFFRKESNVASLGSEALLLETELEDDCAGVPGFAAPAF